MDLDDDIIKDYILSLLDYHQTILKCVNLGGSSNENIKVEISLINKAKTFVKGIK